jgi:hypothetical protein
VRTRKLAGLKDAELRVARKQAAKARVDARLAALAPKIKIGKKGGGQRRDSKGRFA